MTGFGMRWVSGAAMCLGFVLSLPAATPAEEPSAVAPLMKLFQSGKLPPTRQPQVVEMICKRGNESDLRVIFDKVLESEGFSAELREQALAWLTDAAVTRKLQPAGDLSGLSELVVGDFASQQPKVQAAALGFAAACRVTSLSPALQKLALSPQTSPQLKRAAIDGLVLFNDAGSRKALTELAQAQHPLNVRVQAISGIVEFDSAAAAKLAAELLANVEPSDTLTAILDACFEQKDGSAQLAAALAKSKLNPDVAKVLLRHMYSVGRSDAELSRVLSEAAGIAADPPLPTPEEVAALVNEVLAKGDAVRGEAIFRRKDVSCMKCHSVSRAGGQVGPELSAVGGSSPTDYIVNSILNPNLAVKEQYVTKVFELVTGKVLTGVIVDRDEVRVNLRDVNGNLVTIPVADIDDEVEGPSLMPQGLTKFLTHDEVIDLAKFVGELGKPGTPYEINQRPSIQRWRVLREPAAPLVEEVPHLEHVREYILGRDPSEWVPAYARVSGTLPLSELRPATAAPVLILKGEVEVRTAGRVAIAIESTEKTQAWVDAQAFDDRREFEVDLDPGIHAVVLRVELSDRSDPELRVEVRGLETSSAKFQIVGGY